MKKNILFILLRASFILLFLAIVQTLFCQTEVTPQENPFRLIRQGFFVVHCRLLCCNHAAYIRPGVVIPERRKGAYNRFAVGNYCRRGRWYFHFPGPYQRTWCFPGLHR